MRSQTTVASVRTDASTSARTTAPAMTQRRRAWPVDEGGGSGAGPVVTVGRSTRGGSVGWSVPTIVPAHPDCISPFAAPNGRGPYGPAFAPSKTLCVGATRDQVAQFGTRPALHRRARLAGVRVLVC